MTTDYRSGGKLHRKRTGKTKAMKKTMSGPYGVIAQKKTMTGPHKRNKRGTPK